MEFDRQKRLGIEPIGELLAKFSIPAIVGMLVNAFYNIVDRLYIGHIKDVGHIAITGVGLTLPITTMIMAFGMLVGIGSGAAMSIKLGKKKFKEAEKIVGNAFVLNVIISIAITILGLIFVGPLLKVLGSSGETFGYAKEYIDIIIMGTIFNSMAFSMNSLIRAEGNPKMAMITMLIGALINTILDPILIFTFNMGIKGAAIATVISQIVSATWVLSYFLGKKSTIKIKKRNMKLDKKVVSNIFSIGVAPFSMQIAASLVAITANKALKSNGGDLAIGAMAVINSVALIFLMPMFGLNQGSQPIIGFNYGAGNHKRVKDTLKTAVAVATIIAIIGFILIQAFPDKIIGFFNKDPEFLRIGTQGIKIYLFMMPVIGFQIVSSSYFQAVGKSRLAMFLGMLRQVILLIPLLIILPNIKGLGLIGVWLAGPISDVLASIITGILVVKEMRSLNIAHNESIVQDSKSA
ncbi:MATE efflux family protein [Clostridium putrefaciens]|uniref:Multidrug export protein MepA n=1 Tax=Clostridium putrefaciens TaxID=99675 RepID=A0A381JD91_9CLOT|nr:MATE family efflux transporter [Clostridium putrefaciens]SUY48377.1 MATE efflux family protein [Clostridium putrefaciens]